MGEAECSELLRLGSHVLLPERVMVYAGGEPFTRVYFPLSGLVSIVATGREGGTVEVGPVGCDGMIGLPVFLSGTTDQLDAFVQVAPVEAVQIPAAAFREAAARLPGLEDVLRRYVQWTYFSMAQWVLCARLHSVEERLGRWLGICRDRLGRDDFPLTHEFLAQMLGVRRASVTIAAGAFRRAGIVEYRRGRVTILDRQRLDEASCECNRVTAAEYHRLLGRPPVAPGDATEPVSPEGAMTDRGMGIAEFGDTEPPRLLH